MTPRLGATYLGEGRTRFEVWAPRSESVSVHVVAPRDRVLPLEPRENGYHEAIVHGVEPGARYLLRLASGAERPDPASRSQPFGVHGPSQVVDETFEWFDRRWAGPLLRDYVIYELHVGAFTNEGTFDSAIERLADLAALGVTAVEVMPVAQCPGDRNWGYDGVHLFAVQASLGGPEAMKRFVDAAHRRGIAVILDVVYNHLGPEGNYLSEYGPYFTEKYKTPWGAALNFDGKCSDEVRRFFIENALQWVRDFHVDALRLDAVHAILDRSPRPFLEELADSVKVEADRLARRVHLIAESDANDARLVKPKELGGLGLNGVWSDDFHHALHTLLTGESRAYYEGFGTLEHLARAYRDGWTFSGQYAPNRKRRHGSSSAEVTAERFVVCAQNHDQIGNRPAGERLMHLVGFEAAKLAAGVLLLAPYTPLLFMGEEYGEEAPFLYFVHHGDPDLVEAVRKGRRAEFAEFFGHSDAEKKEAPDPQATETFRRSKLDWSLATKPRHRSLLELHRELLRIRKTMALSKDGQQVLALERPGVLLVLRGEHAIAHHFGEQTTDALLPLPAGLWTKVLDSADVRFEGPGSAVPREITSAGEASIRLAPRSFVLFQRSPV